MVHTDFKQKALAFAFSLGLFAAASPLTAQAQSLPDDFAAGLAAALHPERARDQATERALEPVAEPSPLESERLARWVTATRDNNGMPFIVVDKVQALASVYDAEGRLLGAAPALVGSAVGDDSVPGIGDRELSDIKPEERTTPAGRFVAAYGPSIGQGRVLWVDFATAISLHPVVTANKNERRPQRLASLTPEDNRISYGCINVPAAFYQDVVREAFNDAKGVVYVLPDTKPVDEVFPSFGVYLRASAALTGAN